MNVGPLYRGITVAIVISTAASAWAWGNQGHQIVCEIAFQEMSRPARDALKRIIAEDDDYRMFAEACTWPDRPPRKRGSEHFINVPRTFTRIQNTACVGVPTCLFSAIKKDSDTLKDTHASTKARLEALKYLGHWVGDIHQPLHVSYADDRGGNSIDGDGECDTSLHSTWDTCMVAARLGTGDVRAIAEKLRMKVSDADRTKWTKAKPAEWANESYQIAISSAAAYCVKVDTTCRYEANNEELDHGEPRKSVTVDQAYIDANGPTVEAQLTKAGVRLGRLLDDLLAP